MDWTLEAGKYYRQRNGSKLYVGAILPPNPFTGVMPTQPVIGYSENNPVRGIFHTNGRFEWNEQESPWDIVGPWQEPVDVPVTVCIGPGGQEWASWGHHLPEAVGYKHVTVRVQPGDRG